LDFIEFHKATNYSDKLSMVDEILHNKDTAVRIPNSEIIIDND